MSSGPASKFAFLLHADVVGSTTLVQRNEATAHERIQTAFRDFAGIIADYGGTALEIRGDALVAEFEKASSALAAALAFQASNVARNDALDGDIRPRVRIGIGMGEVIIADATVTGAGVVMAQRLEQLAESDGIVVQSAVQEAIPSRFSFRYTDLGEQLLKGFESPVRAFSASIDSVDLIPEPDPRPAERTPTRSPQRRWLIGVAAICVLAVVAGGLTWWQPWRIDSTPAVEQAQTFKLPDKPSIAVLPFENVGGNPSASYFVDGLSSDLITDLSRFHDLFVSASNSSFDFSSTAANTRDIGSQLGVQYLLTGSVQKSGERIRVNAELVEAQSGERLWTERYERNLEDVFEVQDQIVSEIVSALKVRVDELELKAAKLSRTSNLKAYDYILRGRELDRKATREANYDSQDLFRKAIELDPEFAAGYSGLGEVILSSATNGWANDPAQSIRQAHDLAKTSIEIDSHANGHALLGFAYLLMRHFDLAASELDTAISLNPNDASSYAALGSVNLWTSHLDEALEALQKSTRLDPKSSPEVSTNLGTVYFLKGDAQKALAALERAASQNSDDFFTQALLAAAYKELGQTDNAHDAVQRVRELHPFFDVAPYRSAFADSAHGERLAQALTAAGL